MPGKFQSFKIGGAFYVLRGGDLYGADNRLVPLRAKSACMIAVLLSSPGRILSKNELARDVWPGLIATDESISQCISDIRKALNDQDHTIIETFPKRGYRINAKPTNAAPNSSQNEDKRRQSLTITVAAIIAALTAIILYRLVWLNETVAVPSTPPREAIAVLPFESSNGREEDAYLGIGLAEDLIIRLSDITALQVVPGVRSFALPIPVAKLDEVATALDARYLIYGRIQHDRDALQVSVQLIDSKHDLNVWAGKYDLKRNDLLNYHDSVLGDLTKAMSLALTEADERRVNAQETTSAEAFQEVLKGRAEVSYFTVEGNRTAEKHFNTAIEMDRNYARAYAQLAATFAIRFENGWSVLKSADEEKAVYFAHKAIELDPELWLAHYSMGRIYSIIADADFPAAEQHLRTAMTLNPTNDDARIYLAVVKIFSGRAQEALSIIDSVLASHPHPPFWYYLSRGNALLHLERYDEAATALDKCLEQMPTASYCLRFQIANFGLMGNIDDAKWAVEEYAVLGYTASINAIADLFLNHHPVHLDQLRRGLRAAGLE